MIDENFDFNKIPKWIWGDEAVGNAIVIIPTEDIHDSGFNCMKFVLMNGDAPVCWAYVGSDVLALNGIGGYGEDVNAPPQRIAWQLDCLPQNKYIRLWCNKKIRLGYGLSTFEIFAV